MTIIDSLKLVKNEFFNEKHPFAKQDVQFRQTCAIGYAMLICVDGYPSEMAKDILKKQVALLNLPLEFKKQAIAVALDAEVGMILKVLQTLSESKHKYVFMLDLYKLAQQDQKITEAEQEFLVLFEELLRLSYAEVHFIRGFRLAMLRKDKELAGEVVQTAFEQEIAVPLETLSFFLPNFVLPEALNADDLNEGTKTQIRQRDVKWRSNYK